MKLIYLDDIIVIFKITTKQRLLFFIRVIMKTNKKAFLQTNIVK